MMGSSLDEKPMTSTFLLAGVVLSKLNSEIGSSVGSGVSLGMRASVVCAMPYWACCEIMGIICTVATVLMWRARTRVSWSTMFGVGVEEGVWRESS